VFVRQFSDELNEFQLLAINYKQLLDLLASLDAHDGVYVSKLGGVQGSHLKDV
jgi:hypothetical protein